MTLIKFILLVPFTLGLLCISLFALAWAFASDRSEPEKDKTLWNKRPFNLN